MIKIFHLSDLHLGALRDRYLIKCEDKALNEVIKIAEREQPDFIVISGDIFDSNIPSISRVARMAEFLKSLKEMKISTYAIYGSHDFSPTRSTMVEVLSRGGLIKVIEGSIEDKGVYLAGAHGRVGALEVKEFPVFPSPPENVPSIFAFHTAITEAVMGRIVMKAEQMMPASKLPKGFTYYAGGHVHKRIEWRYDGSPLNYPGPLFIGYGIDDLEDYLKGEDRGFYVVELDERSAKFRYCRVRPVEGRFSQVEADGLSSEEVVREVEARLKGLRRGEIALLKLKGTLKSGRRAEVVSKVERIRESLKAQDIYLYVNDRNLLDPKLKEAPKEGKKDKYLEDLVKLFPKEADVELITAIIDALGVEKAQGMKKEVYEKQVIQEVKKLIGEI